MEERKKKIAGALKQATVLFVSVPFFTLSAFAATRRRVPKPDARQTEPGKRISQPAEQGKSPEKRLRKQKRNKQMKQNQPGKRVNPGKRIEKGGAVYLPGQNDNSFDLSETAELVRRV